MTIYDAAMRYEKDGVPLIVIAGEEYGTAARATGPPRHAPARVRAVVAASFERIHRSNLVGMGVLPCQLPPGVTATSLGLTGEEVFDLIGIDERAQPASGDAGVKRPERQGERVALTLRSIRRRNSTTCATAASCLTCSRG